MREVFLQFVWDAVRLLLIPVGSVLALQAVRWLKLKVEQTDLGKRLKIDDVAAQALSRFIVQAEHRFGAAKDVADAGRAQREVLAKFEDWLKAFRLDRYYSEADRAAFLEWVLERLGLFGQSKRRDAVSPADPTKPRIVPEPGSVAAPPPDMC